MPVFIVGSVNVDWVAFCGRLPRPGETVLGSGLERHPGGKGANQAVAAAQAGASAFMVGAVGDDPDGEFMRAALAEHGVDIRGIETVEAATGVAFILVGNGGDNQIVVVPGANHRIAPERAAALAFQAGDVCLAQSETRPEVVQAAFERARSRQALAVFNPAPASPEALALFPLADVIVVNETECASYAGAAADGWLGSPEALPRAGLALGLRAGQALILTLGARGVVAWTGDRILAVPGHPVAAIDATGAGDCFCGYLAAGLERGERLEDCLRAANAAAALAVQTKGAVSSIPARARVQRFLESRA